MIAFICTATHWLLGVALDLLWHKCCGFGTSSSYFECRVIITHVEIKWKPQFLVLCKYAYKIFV